MKTSILAGVIGITASLAMSGVSFSQEAKPAEAEAAKPAEAGAKKKPPALTETSWFKVCNNDPKIKKNVCLIAKQQHTRSGQMISSFTIKEAEGEKNKLISISVPLSLLLMPGVKVQIDDNKASLAKYSICYPNGCYAQLLANDDFITELKRGNKIKISASRQLGGTLDLSFSLDGFTKSYDGESLDPALFEPKSNAELSKKLQEKALQKRKQLEQNASGEAKASE